MFSANENLILRQHKRRIVDWIEECIPDDVLDLGVNVMVMQVSCKAPGCVPIETAIVIVFPKATKELLEGLPESQGGSYKTKILKPMADVTQSDVLESLPPAFPGGLRSVEKLCLTTRDNMLAQITQLFGDDDVEGRRLMATYLLESLQQYMDRDCQPPEWGEPFPEQAKEVDANAMESANGLPKGNVVIRRPDDSGSVAIQAPPPFAISSTPSTSVSSVSRLRQQRTVSQRLSTGPSNTLSRLTEREHAPGLRRPGCPCCDPDNPSNVIDRMMQL